MYTILNYHYEFLPIISNARVFIPDLIVVYVAVQTSKVKKQWIAYQGIVSRKYMNDKKISPKALQWIPACGSVMREANARAFFSELYHEEYILNPLNRHTCIHCKRYKNEIYMRIVSKSENGYRWECLPYCHSGNGFPRKEANSIKLDLFNNTNSENSSII